MVAIARGSVSACAGLAPQRRTTPNLEAQMRTCRAQLADWVTCPSAKTPEGKAKIAQISARMDSIKDQMKRSDGAASTAAPARPASPVGPPGDSSDPLDPMAAPGRIGTRVDTYA